MSKKFFQPETRDAINRRLYKGLIIVQTAIYRVFFLNTAIYRVFFLNTAIYRVFKN
ncbi:hypothetical protein [Nostoc sp. NMS4]|uniref:hypothetical protein n=1 Tax=Nostoc sp. NMS4 TaxID=2815390 RepID=UPI0025E8B350|nr:hypothetical protein [Nostoc sp. NMS4]MBN3927966.1 hypothetical protein [Nostoc sp. NMS4]